MWSLYSRPTVVVICNECPPSGISKHHSRKQHSQSDPREQIQKITIYNSANGYKENYHVLGCALDLVSPSSVLMIEDSSTVNIVALPPDRNWRPNSRLFCEFHAEFVVQSLFKLQVHGEIANAWIHVILKHGSQWR